MKVDEIRGKNDHELGFELAKAKQELFDLRFKSKTQSLPNPSRIRPTTGSPMSSQPP